jgi:hypothetical protein
MSTPSTIPPPPRTSTFPPPPYVASIYRETADTRRNAKPEARAVTAVGYRGGHHGQSADAAWVEDFARVVLSPLGRVVGALEWVQKRFR